MAPKKTDYTASVNDHISEIAVKFKKRDWHLIWKENAAVSATRANPHILFKGDQGHPAGDKLTITQEEEKSVTKATEKEHKFETPLTKLFLRLRILDEEFKPLKQCNFELVLGGTKKLTGKTKDDGTIEQEIPNSTTKALLTVELPAPPAPAAVPAPPAKPGVKPPPPPPPPPVPKFIVDLRIGALNPILEKAPDEKCLSGVQARLNNLGFNAGVEDGVDGKSTQGAIKRFKMRFGIKPDDGTSTKDLQTKMVSVHDRNVPVPPPPAA